MLVVGEAVANFEYETFFRSYAGIWQGIGSEEQQRDQMKYDPHPQGYLRTNTIVQQFPEFYDTFGVTIGDGMYLGPEAGANRKYRIISGIFVF